MKVFQTLFWSILMLAPVGAVFFGLQCIEKTPLVISADKLTPGKVARAKALLEEHDPRRLENAERKTITLSGEELSLMASHVIQLIGHGGASVSLEEDLVSARASVQLPKIKQYYVNIEAAIHEREGALEVASLRFGKLNIPKMFANGVARFTMLHLYRYADINTNDKVIKAVNVSANRLAVTYEWQDKLLDAVREQLLAPDVVARLKKYNDVLASYLADAPQELPLERVVETLVSKTDSDGDPIKENQALIVTLSNYVNGRRMSALLPEVKQWAVPKRTKLTIHGRHDLAQHFATSAALAVAAGGQLSNAIGLFKEIDDSDGGSGFSFKDLAADRAGTRFGKLGTSSSKNASALRARIRSGLGPNDIVPSLTGLEEKMTEAQFKTRYGGVDSERYNQVLADIDARIDASKVYH